MKFKQFGVLGLCLSLSGCATLLLTENTHGRYKKQKLEQKIILEDQVISYGVPSIQIKGYTNAIALAGQKNSYLVKPSASYSGHPALFRNMFSQVDVSHIAFTSIQAVEDEEIRLNSLRDISLFVDSEQKINTRLMFIFLKPDRLLQENEQVKLENLGFSCRNIEKSTEKLLYCRQIVPTEFLITSRAKNTDQLTNKLRQPLNLSFYRQDVKIKYNLKKILLMPLYPVAISYDIVTAPITLGAAYIYFDVMDKPFLKF